MRQKHNCPSCKQTKHGIRWWLFHYSFIKQSRESKLVHMRNISKCLK